MKNNFLERDNIDINTALRIMLESDEYQNEPMVGSFWYDVNNKELFGVYAVNSIDIPFTKYNGIDGNARTGSKLHKTIWNKESHRGKDKRFLGNYTLIPRGRVFEFENQGFKVMVGDWIDKYPEAKDIIIDEFELPSNTEFVKDIHWDIGRGWSDEYF